MKYFAFHVLVLKVHWLDRTKCMYMHAPENLSSEAYKKGLWDSTKTEHLKVLHVVANCNNSSEVRVQLITA